MIDNKEVYRKRHTLYMAIWRAKNPELARANTKRGNAKWRKTKHADYLASKQTYYDKCRKFILDFFGGRCVRCGFDDGRALEMDHVDRRRTDEIRLHLAKRYIFVRDNPDEARQRFQLLCANCNKIKRVENQEYANGRGKRGNGVQE